MAAQILTIAQQKGGAGKTTLAAQLAVAFVLQGKRVATIDIDPQGSLTVWHGMRTEHQDGKSFIAHRQVQGWRLKKEADALAGDHDIVIIDAPPHAESETATAMRLADLVLLPLQPSPMDVWANRPTIEMIKAERRPGLIVLNRVDSRTRLGRKILDMLAGLDIPVARQALGNRVAFAESMMDGRGVLETAASGPAAREVAALVKELKKKLAPAKKAA